MGILVSMLVFYFGIYEVYGVESMQLIRSKHWIYGVSSHEVRIGHVDSAGDPANSGCHVPKRLRKSRNQPIPIAIPSGIIKHIKHQWFPYSPIPHPHCQRRFGTNLVPKAWFALLLPLLKPQELRCQAQLGKSCGSFVGVLNWHVDWCIFFACWCYKIFRDVCSCTRLF